MTPPVTIGERLRLVRGSMTQKAFATVVGVHENTVANAERRDAATQEYLLRLASARGINLHWLLTGEGTMRAAEADRADQTLLQEKLAVVLADALRLAYGSRYGQLPLETRARAVRAATTYLRAIGVNESDIPDQESLARLLKLTIEVMRAK